MCVCVRVCLPPLALLRKAHGGNCALLPCEMLVVYLLEGQRGRGRGRGRGGGGGKGVVADVGEVRVLVLP